MRADRGSQPQRTRALSLFGNASTRRPRHERTSAQDRQVQNIGPGSFCHTIEFAKGARVIEYLGERISSAEADARYEGGPAKHPRRSAVHGGC